ncbi:MAG TPA: hypothetical protein VMA37_00105 [Acetobacteraceae bacterium]|nr:hypothetical protein [Acetobacteraceae bacterium]
MNVEPPIVAGGEATEAGDPSEGVLDHPAMMAVCLTCLDATPGDTRRDLAPAACTARTPMVNGIKQRFQGHAVEDIGRRQQEREWDALATGDEVAPGPGLPAAGLVRARRSFPFFAAMPDPKSDTSVSLRMRHLIDDIRGEWVELDDRIAALDNEFVAYARSNVNARGLATVPGIGC